MSQRANQSIGVDGVLVVDKAAGMTSHDVVSRARRALGTRRVGHVGTLDPMATGVLPLVVGRATRLALGALDKTRNLDAFARDCTARDIRRALTATRIHGRWLN